MKFSCPGCGQNAWGKPDLAVTCTPCRLDMQAERDHLRTHVFPELEERLRERRHFLEWVDLRLGVAAGAEADESARELKVLKVCLAEVKRCRPFLIVLLSLACDSSTHERVRSGPRGVIAAWPR
jgi:hypothetical protein